MSTTLLWCLTSHWSLLPTRLNTSPAHSHPCPETRLPRVSKGKSCIRHVQVDPGVSKHPAPLLSFKTTGLSGDEDSKKTQQKGKLLFLREGRRTSGNDMLIHSLERKVGLWSQDGYADCSQGFASPRPCGGCSSMRENLTPANVGTTMYHILHL